MKQKGGLKISGKYRIIKTDAITGKEISKSDWIKNLIMLDDAKGINLILRRLGNDLTYDCIVTSAEIGTGSTPPTDTDTDLETPELTGILPAYQSFATDGVTISFFIPSVDLPNDTYNEFCLRCGTQIFARSIISPGYVKGTNENTTVEYLIEGSNT